MVFQINKFGEIMGFFGNIFNKEKHLVTDEDFDKRYKIVVIKGFNDNTPEIDDDRYTRILFSSPDVYKDVKTYKFSTGVKELCIKELRSLLFYEDYNFNREDFINYLKKAGCSDFLQRFCFIVPALLSANT